MSGLPRGVPWRSNESNSHVETRTNARSALASTFVRVNNQPAQNDHTHDVPPGPWRWDTTHPGRNLSDTPGGEGLVAADVTWLLWSESGYASIDVHSDHVRKLIADAWKSGPWHELVDDIEMLSANLEDARFWARYHARGDLVRDLEPPDWLTDPDPRDMP
jgi:hypothetical protein